jgi:hypothetical protein
MITLVEAIDFDLLRLYVLPLLVFLALVLIYIYIVFYQRENKG